MKKVAILYKDYSPVIDVIKHQLSDCRVDSFSTPDDIGNYDLVINLGVSFDGEALACRHSLLPAFDCDEPVKEAILAGVKVTGITIYYTKSEKIVAQYPVFINNETHFDELEQELKYVEQTLFPPVIRKILDNEPFEIHALINQGCGGQCGGCGSCSH